MASSSFNVNQRVYSGVYVGNQNIPANSSISINIPIMGASIIIQPQFYGNPSEFEGIVLTKNTAQSVYTCRIKNNTSVELPTNTWRVYWIQT